MSVKDPVYLLFGYVEIKGENGFSERFINLCTAKGIPLWDIHKIGDTITAKTTIGGYKKIRSPAAESSMRVRLIKKHGLPFVLNRCLRHTELIAGFAIMIAVLSILSGRIWIIELDNGTSIPDSDIIGAYEDAGLTIGRSRRVDLVTLCSDVSGKLHGTSWTTVNIIGSTATIKVRETKKTPQIDYGKGTSNIVALKDGQIEIIEPYRGSPTVRTGQTVMQGDLIISGVSESRIQSNVFSDSDGYVVANTTINVEHSSPCEITALKPNPKTLYSLYFLGKEILPVRNKDCNCTSKYGTWLYIGGKKMPFGIYRTVFTNFEEQKVKLNQTETTLNAINDYALTAYNRTLHTQSISEAITIEKNSKNVTVKGAYHCYENIGQKVPLDVEEIPEMPEEE